MKSCQKHSQGKVPKVNSPEQEKRLVVTRGKKVVRGQKGSVSILKKRGEKKKAAETDAERESEKAGNALTWSV